MNNLIISVLSSVSMTLFIVVIYLIKKEKTIIKKYENRKELIGSIYESLKVIDEFNENLKCLPIEENKKPYINISKAFENIDINYMTVSEVRRIIH